MADETTPPRSTRDAASLGEVIDYLKSYARQETVGPLKGAAKFIALGAIGAICLGLGLSLLLLGALRMLQTESFGFETDHHTWINYAIVLGVCAVMIVIALSRINKKFLNKEDKR